MSKLSNTIRDLEEQAKRIEAALKVLRSLGRVTGGGGGGEGRAPRNMSPEGRRRIAEAQKRRWAKVRAAKK